MKIQLLNRVADQAKSPNIVVTSQGTLLDRSVLACDAAFNCPRPDPKAGEYERFVRESKHLTSKIARFYLELKQEQDDLAYENRGLEAEVKVASA